MADQPADQGSLPVPGSVREEPADRAAARMPFLDHLEELRWRILKSLAAILLGAALCLIYSDEILGVLAEPYEGAVSSLERAGPSELVQLIKSWFEKETDPTRVVEERTQTVAAERRLQALRPMTWFFVNLQIAIVGGIILGLPIVFYQVWRFVAPGLLEREKQLMLPILALSILCFSVGAMVAYFVVLPLGLRFFLALEPENMTSQWAVDEYIGFVLRLIMGFGAVFEIPVVTLFLSRIGLVTPAYLRRVRRYAIIIIFALAAIFTPPDPVSQLMMALPLLLLYEISIWVSKVSAAKKSAGR